MRRQTCDVVFSYHTVYPSPHHDLLFKIIFSLIKLPIPAPLSLAGVMGVVGVYAGYKLYQVINPFF